jgi:beta-lactam-binding protein with PASTA domain
MATSSDVTSERKSCLFLARGSLCLRRWRSFRQAVIRFWGNRARHLLLMFAMVAGTLSAAGCKKVSVPYLVDQDLDQAVKMLATVPLKPGTISGSPGTGAYVVSQSLAAGAQVPANSKVDLVVKMPVQVPSLIGSSITDAVNMLQGLNLKVAFVQEHSSNPFSKTKVASQSPAAGSPVHEGGLVTLTVSTPANIEALVGLAAQEPAYQKLKPEYKGILNLFLDNPAVSRSMADQDVPSNPSAPSTPSTPPK